MESGPGSSLDSGDRSGPRPIRSLESNRFGRRPTAAAGSPPGRAFSPPVPAGSGGALFERHAGPYLRRLERDRVDVVLAGTARVHLGRALVNLAERYHAQRVLLDGGPTLNGVMLGAGLVDELRLVVHPSLSADDLSRSAIRFTAPVPDLRLTSADAIGPHLWVRYAVSPTPTAS